MEPPPPPELPYAYSMAHPQEPRRSRWHRAVEIASTVVVGVAVTALALGGLALVGAWVIAIVAINNFGSNK